MPWFLLQTLSSYDETIRFLEDFDRLQLDHLEVLKAILINLEAKITGQSLCLIMADDV